MGSTQVTSSSLAGVSVSAKHLQATAWTSVAHPRGRTEGPRLRRRQDGGSGAGLTAFLRFCTSSHFRFNLPLGARGQPGRRKPVYRRQAGGGRGAVWGPVPARSWRSCSVAASLTRPTQTSEVRQEQSRAAIQYHSGVRALDPERLSPSVTHSWWTGDQLYQVTW